MRRQESPAAWLGCLVAWVTVATSLGSTVTRCEMARLVQSFSLPGNVSDWTCLAQHGSGYNTNHMSTDLAGTFRGLLALPDDYCRSHQRANQTLCGSALCTQFVDNAVADDLSCGQAVYLSHGYSAWPTWVANCQNRDLSSYVEGC